MYWGDTMAYNCLLIDFDETLVSFAESEKQCIAKVYNKYGIPVTEENLNFYHELNEKYWRDYENGKIKKGTLEKARFQKVIEKFGVKNVSGDTMNKDYEHYLKFSAVVMDGALEFLQDVEDYVTIAIVTNGTEDTQNSRLKISKIMDYADDVFTSERTGSNKPDKKIFLTALKTLGIENYKKVLVVGDNLNSDIKGGRNAGLDTCWVNFKNQENNTNIKPTYTAADFEELKRIVLGEKYNMIFEKKKKI
ncbi:MAG: YjjG family noncanonical pyrimidine nucleotidase [Oscillospiraceae bacterium]|nr:YjjG family noncanonical pyrimidine nucleotidase [Oscillospiraceae bacterium]